MTYPNIDVQDDGRVFRIALDNPGKRNAIDGEMHTALVDVVRDADDSDASVVVLTGSGETFSAGGDIEWMDGATEDAAVFREYIREGEKILRGIIDLDKPIVARVNGDCAGSAATYALFCDVVIASEDARIGDPHVSVGLPPGDGGAVIWPLLTDLHTAKELLMTGEMIPTAEAAELGLINRAVPPDELDDEVDELVDKLAAGPQLSIRYTRKILNKWLEFWMDHVFTESFALEALAAQHEDHAAAVDAFLDGREPEFPSARDHDERDR